jgi:hypothetical protein
MALLTFYKIWLEDASSTPMISGVNTTSTATLTLTPPTEASYVTLECSVAFKWGAQKTAITLTPSATAGDHVASGGYITYKVSSTAGLEKGDIVIAATWTHADFNLTLPVYSVTPTTVVVKKTTANTCSVVGTLTHGIGLWATNASTPVALPVMLNKSGTMVFTTVSGGAGSWKFFFGARRDF